MNIDMLLKACWGAPEKSEESGAHHETVQPKNSVSVSSVAFFNNLQLASRAVIEKKDEVDDYLLEVHSPSEQSFDFVAAAFFRQHFCSVSVASSYAGKAREVFNRICATIIFSETYRGRIAAVLRCFAPSTQQKDAPPVAAFQVYNTLFSRFDCLSNTIQRLRPSALLIDVDIFRLLNLEFPMQLEEDAQQLSAEASPRLREVYQRFAEHHELCSDEENNTPEACQQLLANFLSRELLQALERLFEVQHMAHLQDLSTLQLLETSRAQLRQSCLQLPEKFSRELQSYACLFTSGPLQSLRISKSTLLSPKILSSLLDLLPASVHARPESELLERLQPLIDDLNLFAENGVNA